MTEADAVPSFDLVLFGANGDLALRKLLPSLFALYADGRLPTSWQLIGVSRTELSDRRFLELVRQQIEGSALLAAALDDSWEGFSAHLSYLAMDATEPGDMSQFRDLLRHEQVIYYLATRADLYSLITENLYKAGLSGDSARIVLEKPVGLDLESAREITAVVSDRFPEDQVYRIDHYLGKETVQNLLVLRFSNSIFENQWNHRYIDHIQITISESAGVAGRAAFYDQVGALRDMLQNHLLQLLCMTAMEPPYRLHPDAVRDEKVKVLRSLRPMTDETIPEKVVRGQYQASETGLTSYADDLGSNGDSSTETFVALKVEIDNWRWAGVPFYLRTGKRLAERACEIAVHFKPVPHSIFTLQHRSAMANRLVFRLQPDEGIRLSLCEKQPGAGMTVKSSELSLNPESLARTRTPDAYERLLNDVIQGNQTLFVRDDELMAAWEWLDPVIQHWRRSDMRPEAYAAGTWGPSAATLLLARDGRLWDELVGISGAQGGKS